MTIDEAKASLKALCHTCKHFPTCVNDKPECFQAIEMAIKSLEAWEKVKEEIKDLDLGFVDEEYQAGVAYGVMKITEIINKHLYPIPKDGD